VLHAKAGLTPFGVIKCETGIGSIAEDIPSKTRTAEGKSFTRLAARRAAVMTVVEGTRS
jgi:hypothetical protein